MLFHKCFGHLLVQEVVNTRPVPVHHLICVVCGQSLAAEECASLRSSSSGPAGLRVCWLQPASAVCRATWECSPPFPTPCLCLLCRGAPSLPDMHRPWEVPA